MNVLVFAVFPIAPWLDGPISSKLVDVVYFIKLGIVDKAAI